MKVSMVRDDGAAPVGHLAEQVTRALHEQGHVMTALADDIDLVINLTSVSTARVNYVRPNSSVFVASLMRSNDGSAWADLEALKRATYAVLIKTLSNVVVLAATRASSARMSQPITVVLGACPAMTRSSPARMSQDRPRVMSLVAPNRATILPV
jgi:hypothetical protein